ncbi:high-affinity nicotinic acid transporter [Colletotrichum incanum]|uniref:High-affinity nicotinic acid transporter n=1 Tax=Colletotrichum incanum TaxID=1573173 RepID=A0A162NSX0_COLIC|nr:high-affinity nicotinic acid transporter [Colletotrichum incanum]
MCQCATQNHAGILACRFFLGLAEAGFYLGVLYHLSFWYPTHKLPLRIWPTGWVYRNPKRIMLIHTSVCYLIYEWHRRPGWLEMGQLAFTFG